MNPQRGQPASALLASLTSTRLARLLEANADQPDAEALAHHLMATQAETPILTTTALADAVRSAVSGRRGGREDEAIDLSIRRVFQALRIEVNDEFGALDTFLRNLPDCVASGGRIAVLDVPFG